MSAKSPDPDANPVAATLRRRIAEQGPLGFDEFMQEALYAPDGGFYTAGGPRTGRAGHFFTSVSVGPVFGKLLAAQVAEMWDLLGRPAAFRLVEQGADDGQLMADVLQALEERRADCAAAAEALIVEPLDVPRARQRATLARWTSRVRHVAHERELPPFTGVFFANELLDAFPCRLLVREDGPWREQLVAADGAGFDFVEAAPRDPASLDAVRDWPPPEPGGRLLTEWAPGVAPWVRTLAGKLERGWILLADYGHTNAERLAAARAGGSLAAYRDHQRVDNPLTDPGAQDITAHVDFDAVAGAATAAGLQVAGFTDQHHALAALAAEVFPGMAASPLTAGAAREMRGLRQLLHPETMGRAFKFLGLARGVDAPLAMFRFARPAGGLAG